MKWYWILLIVVGVALVIYVVGKQLGFRLTGDFNLDRDNDLTDSISCRPGTCVCTRTDGSKWCSSACCKSASTETAIARPRGFQQVNYTPSPVTPGLT